MQLVYADIGQPKAAPRNRGSVKQQQQHDTGPVAYSTINNPIDPWFLRLDVAEVNFELVCAKTIWIKEYSPNLMGQTPVPCNSMV